MITPKKISVFIGSVITCLLLISLCFPKGEIKISGVQILRFPSIYEIFNPPKTEYADISDLIEMDRENIDSALSAKVLPSENQLSDKLFKETVHFDTVRANTELLLRNFRKLEYPNNDYTILYTFYNQLNNIRHSKNILRIMHYGDSQIEGDRITSFIREKFQEQFGGSGPGILPVVQPYGQFSMKQEVSGQWKRYTLFGSKNSSVYHNRYGVLASFCRFSPTNINEKTKTYEAWFKTESSVLSYPLAKNYEKFRIFYGYNKKPFIIQLYSGKKMIDADFIPVSNDMNVLEWDFKNTPGNLTVKIKGEDSPDIYALSFEGNGGVVMDNIPMRGSSGLVFTKMDRKLMKNMYNEMGVNLIILQFGGNAVPYIADNYERYGRLFYEQLMRLKSIVPGVPIVVVGVADMSVKEKGIYKTYPVLPKVRDAMKKAAFDAGCAYWDMYEAMGGENSMPSWVFARPSLASSDFVHFNHKGARLIAEMFYQALIYDYNKYLKANMANMVANR